MIEDKEKELEVGKPTKEERSNSSKTQTKDAERHDKKDAYDWQDCKKPGCAFVG